MRGTRGSEARCHSLSEPCFAPFAYDMACFDRLSSEHIVVRKCRPFQANPMNRLLTLSGLALCLLAGCSSEPAPHGARLSPPAAPLSALVVPVPNPVEELCTDDTHSHTEWFNQPVVKFSGQGIERNGRAETMEALLEWGKNYSERKVERVLYVQISPDSRSDAERAISPLTRMFPDLHVRQVEFGFSCPKIQR